MYELPDIVCLFNTKYLHIKYQLSLYGHYVRIVSIASLIASKNLA